MTRLTYAVVTPARDEETNLRRLGRAMAAQLHAPIEWVVVDDGSVDATADVITALAAEDPWIRLLARDGADRAERLADGRRRARDLDAFLAGARALAAPADIVVKVDADVDFEPDFFARLIGAFEADPSLAIASGTCFELEDGVWVRRTKAADTVWGATRAYRRDCLADVEVLEPCMGWDGLDEIRVQLRGLATRTLVDLPFRHNRPEGGRELTSLHHGEALGRASYYMGYRPSFLAMRALYRARREPAALAMLWGYGSAAVRRDRRCPDRQVVRELRRRQRLSTALRRGAPTS